MANKWATFIFYAFGLYFLFGCSHVTYTPTESALKIAELEKKIEQLTKDLQEAEDDLDSCIAHLITCQPLINVSP
jgi:hypothetical protein